jgi:hypothetical protein
MGFGLPRYVGLSRSRSLFHLSRTGASTMLRPREHGLADSFISLSVCSLLAVPGPNPFRSVFRLPLHDTHRLSAHTERVEADDLTGHPESDGSSAGETKVDETANLDSRPRM